MSLLIADSSWIVRPRVTAAIHQSSFEVLFAIFHRNSGNVIGHCSDIKVVLWRKSHLSYLSHFKTKTSRHHEQKKAVYCFQISLFVPEIFKFLKYANETSDDVIHSTRFCSNMMKRDISANLYQKCLILCSKMLLNVSFNTSLTVLLPWQHTGFQTSPYRVSCHGNRIFYSHRCVWCRTISVPSFNALHLKLAKIAPFICLI